MSGSRPKSEGHLAEQHLGDRLSALVDGELGHDARERVLAHVATCAKCKAEVDAQRRLKNVFAEAAPPPPSESLLARLQGLPAGGGQGGGGMPPGGAGLPGGVPGRSGAFGGFGAKRGERFEFDHAPARRPGPALPVFPGNRGFGIHDVGRHETDRPSSRLRIAFVAAGAVSLAAIALGGVTAGTPTDTESRGGSGTGSNVTPTRTQGTGAAATPESQRRRGVGPLLGQLQGQRTSGDAPVAPTEVSAPLLPGVPHPAARHQQGTLRPLAAPVGADAATAPLIRPPAAMPPFTLSTWPTTSALQGPGLLAAPVPGPSASSPPSPSSSASSRPAP
ncbi:zf-HC2 domain-containing protein [Streptomyces sp. NPDC052701]|uniref:anti-sigma factor family protein n=1 Tax=Streptomyces sp. NPDC052701 TaxID=3155533 RepID=UPI0034383874